MDHISRGGTLRLLAVFALTLSLGLVGAPSASAVDTEGPPGHASCVDGGSRTGRRDLDSHAPTGGPAGAATCADGPDNDGDGQLDTLGSDCQSQEGPPSDPSCHDGIDNDGDGDTDTADAECQLPTEG